MKRTNQLQPTHRESQARSATKARGTRDTSARCAVYATNGSSQHFLSVCFFRCLSLRTRHRISLRSISELSTRTRGTESCSSPKHMDKACLLLFASARRPIPFSTETASLMRSVWLDLTRQTDPTHCWVGDT